jgi:hypothetical protein
MKPNRLIETSRCCFTFLLNLYPREHRADYAASMRQVFADQCRDAYREKGILGIFFLWLRVLPDLGYTAVLEHLTSPQAAWGLMEPVPNAPLPWKGVFLILLPGLVYLVSQIAQLNGQTWYLTVYYRAAFFLIIPVLIAWAVTRRFPIWGLIPVGLLFKLVQEIGYQLIILHPDIFSSNPLLNAILITARWVESDLLIPSLVFTTITVLLAIMYFRKNKPTRGFWVWGGAFLLLVIIRIAYDSRWVLLAINDITQAVPVALIDEKQSFLIAMLHGNIAWTLYNTSALLLLIFIGTLFIRRHGFFTILIPVGYILPVMVVGTPWDLENYPDKVLIISMAVLAYRSLLSLIAPIWMSRTRTQTGKKRVIILCIAFALTVQTVMQFYPSFLTPQYFIYGDWVITVLLDELTLVFALLLGMALYQTNYPPADEIAPAFGAFPQLITGKPTNGRLEPNQSIMHFGLRRSKSIFH